MKHKLKLPYHYGSVIDERLKVLERKVKYQGYTLDEELNIVQTECSIGNDGSYNYHNNYDDSKDVLKVGETHKWWTLNGAEIKRIQKEHIDEAIGLL